MIEFLLFGCIALVCAFLDMLTATYGKLVSGCASIVIVSCFIFICWEIDNKPRVSPPDVFFYHHPCPDGLSCRLINEDYFSSLNTNVDYREWTHGKPANLTGLEGKTVWFVDVSPTIEQLKSPELTVAKKIIVLDHHNNASTQAVVHESRSISNLTITLEMENRCGALMLYSFLYPRKDIPVWLNAINKGDTNLISTRTEDEKAYHAWITRPDALKSTAALRDEIYGPDSDMKTATEQGRMLIARRIIECEIALKSLEMELYPWDSVKNYTVGYTSASGPEMISMINDYIWKYAPKPMHFLCIRWIRMSDGLKQISLRRPPDLDLSDIARWSGGNGHPAASGVQGLDSLKPREIK